MLVKEHRKHRLDVYEGAAPIYNVVSSDNSQKLTLKLSKTKDEPRGMCLRVFIYVLFAFLQRVRIARIARNAERCTS